MKIEHTDEEIITYLESAAKVADCEDCAYKNGCDGCLEYICKEALDLIERQKSEVERLTVELEAMRTAANSYKMHYENLAREIFEEIEKITNSSIEKEHFIGAWFNMAKFEERLAELKKKYQEGE